MVEDWDINVSVRQELVKRFVDLRRIKFNTIASVVHLKGSVVFVKTKDSSEKIVASIEERLEAEKRRLIDLEKRIRKIKGVKAVIFDLEDWVKFGSEWKRKTG
ncbi:MAG: hypothetical protein AB1630_02780 [bacterium]